MERKSSSSSSRRRNSVGCMSAIFNLLSKHKRSKYISSGKEQRKEAANEQRQKDAKLPTRSPSLPVEMRRSSENRPHGLVARLMGLDMFPPSPESSSGADQKLKLQQLDELEKCDEDLKALQRIIEVVKTSISVGLGDKEELRRRRSLQQQQQQQQQQLTKKKAVEEYITATAKGACSFLDRFTTEPVAYAKSDKNEEENAVSGLRGINVKAKAMKHSVDEVCKDIAWGEKREIGRISLALQHHICRDLIHELVSEIACYSN